jgi:hypothetical protein
MLKGFLEFEFLQMNGIVFDIPSRKNFGHNEKSLGVKGRKTEIGR